MKGDNKTMSPALFCPYDGKLVPIFVHLVGYDVDDEYIKVIEYTSIKGPIPHIEISVELNMERIVGDIDQLYNNRIKKKECGPGKDV